MNEFLGQIDTKETDFIERLKQIAEVKMEYSQKHPNVLNFLGSIFIQEDIEVPDSLKHRYEGIMQMREKIMYENIDTTLFRKDVDTEKAYKLIQWSLEGYQNDLIRQLKHQNLVNTNMDPYWDEFYEYLGTLKTLFYKGSK
ncbi:hypothetical protein [Oceanobacillus limi]|uniref:hypothetical protein n=1 Tax=Oceanobacillus limi TaxID=930131 RepID=UPI001FCCE91D|nr:hypothetical protein [Oceanobacillus limi]